MVSMKKYFWLLVFTVAAAIFQTMGMKACVGVLPAWDSVSLAAGDVTGIRVGTITIILNTVTILIQLLILQKDFHLRCFLEIPLILIYGEVINFMYYDIFTFTLSSYVLRIAVLVVSYTVMSAFLAAMTLTGIISMPIEGTSYAIHEKFNVPFVVPRVIFDTSGIVISLILTFFAGASLYVREGTVIGLCLIGPAENFFIGREKQMIQKHCM